MPPPPPPPLANGGHRGSGNAAAAHAWQAQGAAPMVPDPLLEAFNDVMLVPSFTSQEISLLMEVRPQLCGYGCEDVWCLRVLCLKAP